MEIGENIRWHREAMGLSQAELARRIGKTPSTISQYESGTVNPRMPILERIADVLDVPPYRLLGTVPDSWTAYAMIRIEVTQDEEELVDIYRRMDADKREQLMRIARAL